MGMFVFSTEKPIRIAANMNEKLRNVVLVAGLITGNGLRQSGASNGDALISRHSVQQILMHEDPDMDCFQF